MGGVAGFGAAAVAEGFPLALGANGVADGFVVGKLEAAGVAGHLVPGVVHDVAELPGLLDEEVAGVDVAVVFDYGVAVAGFMHGAGAGFLSGERFGEVVEEADAHGAALGPPEVEGFAEELAVFFGGDGVGEAVAVAVEFGKGDVLHVVDAEFAEELVDLAGACDVDLIDDAEDVEFDVVLLHSLDGLHDALPGGVAGFVDTVGVVDFLGAVHGDSD